MPTDSMSELTHADLCCRIVEDAPDAIIFADRDGIIRLWNSGAQAIFGFTAAEAVGQTLDLIIPEKLRPRHWQGYHAVMASGVSRYSQGALLAVPAIRRDGERLSVEFTLVLMRQAGIPVGATAIIRDVTARWRQEQDWRRRLAALERQQDAGRGPVTGAGQEE